jgi:DNA-binding SARP family transcriptional activator
MSRDALVFRLLGPVEAICAGRPVRIGGPKPRSIVAALLVRRGQPVDVDQLIDTLWGERPPKSARSVLHTYLSTLRRAFADAGVQDVVGSQGGNYWIEPTGGWVDLHDFEDAVAGVIDRSERGLYRESTEIARAALSLWRGTVFGGVTQGLLETEAARVTELRMTAQELRVHAGLALGDGELLIPELRGLVKAHPSRERFWEGLMVALHRAGRPSEALAVYECGRRVLADELGVNPSARLQRSHQTILDGDTSRPPS